MPLNAFYGFPPAVVKSQPRSKITSLWNDAAISHSYRSGVSLHSHTSMSEETMTFVHKFLGLLPGLQHIFAHYDRKSRSNGFQLDFVRGNWRPPLVPAMAYELESKQIEQQGLQALVSITDHDTIAAPQLLRNVPSARGIPVSMEWTVPYGPTEFHLGVHNLPSADAYAWTDRLNAFTAAPSPEALRSILHELDELPGVLTVFNHPVWDLHKIGAGLHRREVFRFLESFSPCIHAMELNGLRDARENREVAQLARETGHLLLSGGDRHGTEASACINLSGARNFREFVDEIRVERRSHVLFMDQYKRPWQERILHSTLDAVTDFPEFPEGWQRWDDRAFHPDRDGVMRPLRQLWEGGAAPWPLRAAIQFVRMGRSQAFSRTFALAVPGVNAAAEMELL
ncbi:MAG TPA: hypothetical protein VKV02_15005 [Acidobacteriaceae bacterium]|nr:hypothetical protein [Acidobacteriaceae bacterium]